MQINKPPSSGIPTTGGGISSPAVDKANRAENPLAQLVGQLVSAQVLQSKAVEVAAAQATALEAGVAARLIQDQGGDKKAAASNTSSAVTPATTSSTTSAPTNPANTATAQTQYQTTLQIGNERVVVMTEQPLPPGSQLLLKVSSPQLIQLVEQPATTPPVATADIADNLLNTLLRQALPLQQPIAKLLASIVSNALLTNTGEPSTPMAGTSSTANALATGGLHLPSTLSPAVVTALKPLLSQIVASQLTLDTVTEPGALRNALANSGLFREARLVQWAQALLKQFPNLPTSGGTSNPSSGTHVSAQFPATTMLATPAGSPASDPLAAALQNIATRNTATQTLAAQIVTATQTALLIHDTNNQTQSPTATPGPDAIDGLDARQLETLRNATAATGSSSQAKLHDAIDADVTDVDALRKELLQALSQRAQKNQPAFAGATQATTATQADTTAQTTKVAAGISAAAAGNAIPVTAPSKTAEAGMPLATGAAALSITAQAVTSDVKTTLEQLVSVTSQRLLSNGSAKANSPISEEQVLAILRQLPMAHAAEPQAATKGKPKDDDQWLIQLLRSSFGALKHLQLQQATNINAAPGAQPGGNESPIAPVQIELPILVAQQWQNINIEIDRRAPDNKSDAGQTERGWRVTLRFELPQQGIIVAQLNLSGMQVNATLWAEKQATCQQLQQQLKELSDRLGKVGAHVTTLDVRHGQPPSSKTRVEQRLIDIRT